jgi:hypothetical protein
VNVVAGRRRDAWTPTWGGAVAFGILAAVALLATYLVHPLVAGHRLPIGPDGPVYTWLARAAEATGFSDGPGAGPGIPGLTLLLGRLLGTEPLATVTLLGPVLAACCGLGAAAVVESSLGPSLARAAFAAILTGAFTAYLAGGWLANVAMVAMFLAASAALSLAGRSWAAVGLAAGLLAASGLTHRVFFGVGLVILALVVAALIPDAARRHRDGMAWRDTAAARIGVAVGAGGGLAVAGLALLAPEPGIPGDTSQDGFFRRLGFVDLLVDRYRERFWGDVSRAAVPVAAGIGLAAMARRRGRAEDRRFLTALWWSWAAVTAVGIVVLGLTAWGPPNRMLQFAFFVPVGAAVGAAELIRRGRRAAAAAVIVVPAFVAVSMVGWFRQSPAFTAEELAAAERAGAVMERLDPETPVIVVVDTDQPAAAYHVTRAANVIRMAAPPERIRHVGIAVGRPEDVIAGRVTRTGDPEHDLIAAAYLREVEPVLDRATVLVVRPFNPRGWPGVSSTAFDENVAVVLPSDARPPPSRSATTVPGGSAPLGVEGLELAGRSVAAVLFLAVLGGGWARWGLGRTSRRAAVSAAPSVGAALGVAATFVADRLGLPLDGAIPMAFGVAVGGAGYAAAWLVRRSDGASREAPADRLRVEALHD